MSRAASFFTEALAWSASAVLRGLEPLRPGAVVEGVAGHEDLGGPVEHADVAEGVTGGRDHLQPEDLGAVGRGDDRARAGDLGDVGRTRVHGGLGGPGRHVREAPRVVAVVVREDEVGHGLPARPGGLQGRPDGVRAAGHPGVHDRGLPATDQDVRGHEAEVGAGPGQLSGRGGAVVVVPRWCPSRPWWRATESRSAGVSRGWGSSSRRARPPRRRPSRGPRAAHAGSAGAGGADGSSRRRPPSRHAKHA